MGSVLLSTPHVFAAPGTLEQINFQGKVVNKTAGTNITDGTYSFTFRIYDVSSGGTHIWTETKNITVTNGIFQTMLGDTTSLPGSVDFNTDNLYLGINFNSDGEMSPRVRFGAVPQALNALKVAGLTVTDTTGTLTIPNGTTIGFSGANNLTFTTSGVTSVTLPTTGTLSTLAGSEILTNKTIGSTGLMFSGSTTDITTATDEGFTLTAAGTGDIVFTTDSDTTLAISNLANCDTIDTDSNGVLSCGTDAGGAGASSLQGAYDGDADNGNATITLSSTDDSIVITNPSSSGTDSSFVVQFNQNNTTAAISVLDIVQSSDAANGVNITANSINTESGLAITANALTSGQGLIINSSSTAFTGALAQINLSGSNAANTGSLLALSNTGTANANTTFQIQHDATGTNNLALRINDEASDTTPFIIDGNGRVGIGTETIAGTTERLLQVGSETNRGNAAVYGELISKGIREFTTLANIRDVFIYDTTTDSDGGKWIDWATTDKLSWFTESLDDSPSDPCDISTDDRCYSANFPRKAILIVTTDALYIFDAKDNVLWMKFSQNASGYALGIDTNNDPSSVTALNGVIYVGTNGSAPGGLYAFDFISDRMWKYDSTDRSQGDLGIASRNSAITYNTDNNTAFDLGNDTGWDVVNDVSAATSWGSTSLGPASGNTFVGIATDSGLGVINLSAQKYLAYSETADNDYNAVFLTRRGRLYGLNEALGQAERWNNYDVDTISEEGGNPDKLWDETGVPSLAKTAPTIIANAPDALEVIERGSLADATSDVVYVGHSLGMTEIHDHATVASGWSKFYSNTRQTPFMPATIRGAFLMDDASGDITDSSLRTHILEAKGSPTYGEQGVRGNAITLNGTSQYLCADTNNDGTCDLDTTFNMTTTSWTISGWFKHSTSITGNDVLFSRCYTAVPAAAGGCIAVLMNSTGRMGAFVDDDATWTAYSSADMYLQTGSGVSYADNQWHHFVLTKVNAGGAVTFLVDGRQVGTTASGAGTYDYSQMIAIGADCSVGANCSTGANFWDGSIDDFTISAGGSTTTDQLTAIQANALYNDARPLMTRKVINVTDATSATTNTITDTGESWIINEFVGQIVTLTEGTGAGQTRRIISNTATTLTVTPDFSTTPDTTTNFSINPEVIYGASNSVTAIGTVSDPALGEARHLCLGTNDTSDGGGVTCLNHQAGPNIVADVYHSDAEQFDGNGAEWTGANYDDMRSIDVSGGNMVMANEAGFWTENEDVRLGQGLDKVAAKIFDIRAELLTDAITGTSLSVGYAGGADLAEWYYADETIPAGSIVALDDSRHAGIKKTVTQYQKDSIGIVATEPGVILGDGSTSDAHAVALVGRVPVFVTTQNGTVTAGDRITSSDIPGFGMKAQKAGRVIGVAMGSMDETTIVPCPENTLPVESCHSILVFVNLNDYTGESIDVLMAEQPSTLQLELDTGLNSNGYTFAFGSDRQNQILSYLVQQQQNNQSTDQLMSDIFTDRIYAVEEVITPTLIADLIIAKKIRADQIEGLEIYTDSLATLSAELRAEIANNGGAATQTARLNTSSFDTSFLTRFFEAIENIVFKGSVKFLSRPIFNKDTGGFAKIKQNHLEVQIIFDKPYERTPVVVASSEKTTAFEVIDKSEKGFTIKLGSPATQDIQFSWTALDIEDVKTFESLEPSPTPQPSIYPTPTPFEPIPEPLSSPVPEPSPIAL